MTQSRKIQEQAEQIHTENERARLLLDATPFACRLWNRDLEIIACNEACISLFKVKDKEDYIDKFFDLMPEFQPDGRRSREKAVELLGRAFEEGKIVLEWMHRSLDGTPMPTEVTLVCIKYGDEDVVAGYTRDLSENKQMLDKAKRSANLLSVVNQAANILLQSESGEFESNLYKCMGMVGGAVNADRVCLWKNHSKDGKLYCNLIREWPVSENSKMYSDVAVDISYEEQMTGWEEVLSQGNCINSTISELSPQARKLVMAHGVKSLFLAPVFIRDEFWGCIGFDDYKCEKVYPEGEVVALHSCGLLIASLLLQNEMKLDLQTLASELHDALKAAESANQAKTNFLANMSHEMRTPLNAVLGLSELLLESGEVHEECFINLEKINSAGMVLLNMVNDILDISKIEAGKYDITPVEYDVPSLINDAVTQSIMFRNEKPVEFVLSIDGNLPTQLYGDEIRIKQIFNNLLSNAFKYTKEGEVEFGISCDRGEDGTALLIACVKDTGKGIQPEGIKRMFEDYAQLDAYSNREVTGTGLGLPIVRRLLDLMGGSIDVESEYGKGSTFTMRLPQKYVTDAVIGPEMAENLKAFNYHEQKRKWNAKLARIIMPYARVLVVDDVVTNLDVAKGLMKPYGMQIDCVTSGQQAIDAIRDESVVYNAVFMDHMMPCMDGVEATQRIREIGTEYAKSVPIIALTANAIAGNEEMFLDKGFQAFISKPIEIARLDAVVRQWVRDKEQEKLLDFKQITVDGMPVLDTRKGGERRSETERRGVLDRRILGRLYYGLNAKKGMERFGGDKEVYLNVLHSFAKNTKPLLEQARGVTHEALPDYAITVHGIKGSSRGIFAEEIGTKAEALEVAARSDDFDYIIENNQAFIETVERFLVDIEDMLDRINAENAKPKKEKPDNETLANLLAAAEGFDMDGADMAITELMRYEYASEGKLVDWLREMVAEADFAQIAERLAGYAGFGGTNGK